MKTRFMLTLAFVLAIGLVAGCGKESSQLTDPVGSSGTASNHQAEISSVLASTPDLIEDAVFESADETRLDDDANGTLAAIRPFRFWRHIEKVERSFTFAFADTDTTGQPTTAVVRIDKQLTGTFNILTGVPRPSFRDTLPRDSVRIVRKPLQDHWVRRVLLHRMRLTPSGRPVWRVVASSGVEVTSRGATTEIQSLRVQTASFDSTFTDPLAFFRLRRLVKVNPMEKVTLTVTTGRDDDVVVLMCGFLRFRFHNNGDGTYTGEWRSPMFGGIRHVGVNAFSNGTLFDDQEPYDSNAWILPYLVHPHMLAEYMP
jgi:hypothetical protein